MGSSQSKSAAPDAAAAQADAGSAGFGEGTAVPNARPTGAAGRGAADPNPSGPVRSMGAREGAPGRNSPQPVAEAAAAPDGDAPAPASGSGGGESAPGSPKDGAGAGGSGDDPSAGPASEAVKKARGHHHGAHPDAADPEAAKAESPEDAPGDAPLKPIDAPGFPGRVLAQVSPIVGAPVIKSAPPSGAPFAETPGGAATVQTAVVQTATAKAVEFTTKLSIDPNGAGGWYRAEDNAQRVTALQYSDGKNLNPGKIPFVAIPQNFSSVRPEVKLGDYAAVSYGGKTVYAIVGDYGPAGVIGGGSMVLASGLGINADPKGGGASAGVSYIILAGSGGGDIPRDAAGIETAGKAAFDKAGIPVR